MEDCSRPPALTDTQLLQYVEASTDAGIAAHLADCPACAARLRAWQRTTHRLAQRLYRYGCLDPLEFGEYVLDRLTPEQRRRVDEHVRGCPACAAELALTRSTLAPHAGEARSILEPLRVLVAALLPAQPVSAVRGEEITRLRYQADDITLVLEVVPMEASPEDRRVRGSVLGLPAGNWRLEFWMAGRLAATAPIDDLSYFTAEPLAAGRYEALLSDEAETLTIRLPQVTL